MKHANSILETFEYFCQKSSKSITIILSYTVSKLVHFFETQCRLTGWLFTYLFHIQIATVTYGLLADRWAVGDVYGTSEASVLWAAWSTEWNVQTEDSTSGARMSSADGDILWRTDTRSVNEAAVVGTSEKLVRRVPFLMATCIFSVFL